MRNRSLKATLFFLVLGFESQGQTISFPCDSHFKFFTQDWSDNRITALYDSLNRINFSEIDFEARIWKQCNGQLGMENNVFIMRHCRKKNIWRGYYYKGFRGADAHKTMSEYFKNAEITKYKPKQWKTYWDTLISDSILTLKTPTRSELEKALNKNNPKYPEETILLDGPAHDCFYVVELVGENCRRSYSFNGYYLAMREFYDLKEIQSFKKILDVMNKVAQ